MRWLMFAKSMLHRIRLRVTSASAAREPPAGSSPVSGSSGDGSFALSTARYIERRDGRSTALISSQPDRGP